MAKRGGQRLGVGGTGAAVTGVSADMQPSYSTIADDGLGVSDMYVGDEDSLQERAKRWDKEYTTAENNEQLGTVLTKRTVTVNGVTVRSGGLYNDEDIKRLVKASGAKKGQHVEVEYLNQNTSLRVYASATSNTAEYWVDVNRGGRVVLMSGFDLSKKSDIEKIDRIIKGSKSAKAAALMGRENMLGMGTERTSQPIGAQLYAGVQGAVTRGTGGNSKPFEMGFYTANTGVSLAGVSLIEQGRGGLAGNFAKTDKAVADLQKIGYGQTTRIENVVRTPAGRDWFRKYGGTEDVGGAVAFKMYFSLNDGGYSLKRWAEFKNRNK